MKNNDFDFISSKFDEENIKAPENLSAERITENFDKKNTTSLVKFKVNTRGLRAFIAAVACFVIVVTSFSAGLKAARRPVKSTEVNPKVDGISYFKNYDSLNAKLGELMEKENRGGLFVNRSKILGTPESGTFVEDAESAESDKAVTVNGGKESHAETNRQVDAVDEADIVKTDGKYIYYILNNYESGDDRILIYAANRGKTQLVSTVKGADDGTRFKEMYLKDGKLIAVGTSSYYYMNYNYDSAQQTSVYVYDVSDVKNPKLVDEYKQDGSYLTSRFLNDTVYIVSDFYRYFYNNRKDIKDFVPRATNAKGETEKLSVDDICCIDDCSRSGYSVIGAVDVNSKKNKTYKTKAVLGAGDKLYCNENNLYLATTDFKSDSMLSKGYTRLVKFNLNKTKIKLTACGEVKGTVNDQFSLDEKDGKLRIATTVSNNMSEGGDVNFLYILDEKLKKTGEVSGFARNEHIEAVRYIGNTAYVITFERTDPLFVIDLSDIKHPKITGEVKIDGFSSSLTPVDENTLLGIGYSTKTNEMGGVQTNGLKIVLFDISDKNRPKVISEKEMTGCSSPAQENHKAIVINKEKGYFAIPINEDYENSSVGIIKIDGKGFSFANLDSQRNYYPNEDYDPYVNGEYIPYEGNRIERCTYIGDYIYALYNTESETLEAFEVK